MEIKVCNACKKMFQYMTGSVLCPNCKQKEEELFLRVKEYLRDNPGDTMHEVNKATGVSVRLIEKFLRQGRLQVAPDSPIAMKCESCGKKIQSGRLCKECKQAISSQFEEVKKTMISEKADTTSQTGAKMRFLKID